MTSSLTRRLRDVDHHTLHHHRASQPHHCETEVRWFKPKPALGANKPTSPRKRSRGGAWTRMSRAYRKANPICERCNQRAATQAHHRVHLKDGGELLDWTNLEALCDACHAAEHE